MWGLLINGISKAFSSWQDGRNQINQKKLDVKLAKLQAEETRWMAQAHTEAEWDLEALRQSQYSWKDEWLLLILTLPFIGSFIPNVQDHIQRGWLYVKTAPEWYQIAFLGVVAASFGLRWLIGKNLPEKKPKKEPNSTSVFEDVED